MGRQARVIKLAVLIAVTLAVGAAVFAANEETPGAEKENTRVEEEKTFTGDEVEEALHEKEQEGRIKALEDRISDQTQDFLIILGALAVVSTFIVLLVNHLNRRHHNIAIKRLIKKYEGELVKLSRNFAKRGERILEEMERNKNYVSEITKMLVYDSTKIGERIKKAEGVLEAASEELPPIEEAEKRAEDVETVLAKYPGLRFNADLLYEAAIKGDITEEGTLNDIFSNLYFAGEYRKALDIINILIKNKPINAHYHFSKGVALYRLGRFNEAVEAYDMVIKLNAENADVYVNKGAALYKAGKNEEALAAYDKAIEFNPEDVDIYIDQGTVFNISGKYEEALNVLRKAIEFKPELSRAYQGISYALIYLGRYDEAVEACDKAIELEPNAALAYNNRSCAYALLGKKDEMLADLRKATELDDKFREEAKKDESFDAFRDDPAFRRLIFPEEFEGEGTN